MKDLLYRKLLSIVFLLMFSNGVLALSQLPEGIPDELAELYEETVSELNLTPEQQLQLFPVIQSSFEQRAAVYDELDIKPPGKGVKKRPPIKKLRQLKNKMDAIDRTTKKEVSEILTDEQLRIWEDLQQERKQKMRKRMLNS